MRYLNHKRPAILALSTILLSSIASLASSQSLRYEGRMTFFGQPELDVKREVAPFLDELARQGASPEVIAANRESLEHQFTRRKEDLVVGVSMWLALGPGYTFLESPSVNPDGTVRASRSLWTSEGTFRRGPAARFITVRSPGSLDIGHPDFMRLALTGDVSPELDLESQEEEAGATRRTYAIPIAGTNRAFRVVSLTRSGESLPTRVEFLWRGRPGERLLAASVERVEGSDMIYVDRYSGGKLDSRMELVESSVEPAEPEIPWSLVVEVGEQVIDERVEGEPVNYRWTGALPSVASMKGSPGLGHPGYLVGAGLGMLVLGIALRSRKPDPKQSA